MSQPFDNPATPESDRAPGDELSPREKLFARPRWSWNIIAVVCLVAATIALLNSYIDAAFVAATLGVVAWFLEVRSKYKVARVEDDEADAESEFEENRDEH